MLFSTGPDHYYLLGNYRYLPGIVLRDAERNVLARDYDENHIREKEVPKHLDHLVNKALEREHKLNRTKELKQKQKGGPGLNR